MLTLTSERDLRDAIASVFGFRRRHLSPRAVVSTATAYVNSYERLRPAHMRRCCIQRYEALASDDAIELGRTPNCSAGPTSRSARSRR